MNTLQTGELATGTAIVFLDRDGTVIVEKHYLRDPAQVALLPRAAEGLRQLGKLARLVLVSNQSGIGRGLYTEDDLRAVNARLCALLEQEGVRLDSLHHCPHAPDVDCNCRKPKTGMVDEALHVLGRRPGDFPGPCYVIGDKPCDVELATAIGGRGILVRTGYGATCATELAAQGVIVVDNLAHAAAWIAENLESAQSVLS